MVFRVPFLILRGEKVKRLFNIISVILSLLLITSCLALSVSADVGFDGINYLIDSSNFTATVNNYYGNETDVSIPEYVNGFRVVAIEEYAFSGKNIESVSIPGTVTRIGGSAFSNCVELQQITVPASVTEMGNNVFSKCEKLQSVSFLASMTSIPMNTFESCPLLSQVVLSESVERIENGAFSGCASLESFPFENVKVFCSGAFNKCGLKSVVLSEDATTIDMLAFANNSDLQSVNIPASVSYISSSAFKNDTALSLGVYYDSYAYNYARNKSIEYSLIDGVMLGDVDGIDGVNISDATAVQSYLAELRTLEGIYLLAADANQDGDVDITDATAIQMKVADYELPYPIGQYITKEIVSE